MPSLRSRHLRAGKRKAAAEREGGAGRAAAAGEALGAVPRAAEAVGYLPARCALLPFPAGRRVSLFALLNRLLRGASSSLLSSELESPAPLSVLVEGPS